MNDTNEIINTFLTLENQKFHRFGSWNKCYDYFQNIYFKNKSDDDTAALHLGFYLASWGMYRGSSFLLQNDYKIHIGVVTILKEKFEENQIISFEIMKAIKENIVTHYKDNAHPNTKGNKIASDTLITKILLGTLGSIPAYDRFFVDGLKKYNQTLIGTENESMMIPNTFSKKSFERLNEFYENNIDAFNGISDKYPRMKQLDMFFWKAGYDDQDEKKIV